MESLTILMQGLLICGLLLQSVVMGFALRRSASFAGVDRISKARRVVVAVLLALAAAATLVGAFAPFLVFFAALLALLACVIALAVFLRARMASLVALSGLLAFLCAGVAVMQPLGLKVLALPKAADLPYRPLQSRVLKTYDEGLWFEGIAAAEDGTLYLTGNRGLDFSARKYYASARGELIERKADGTERTLFETPVGSTAGVVAVTTDRTLYMTSHGDAPGIWRIAPTGEARKIAVLPRGAWPNGLDVGPDGMLYTPDSTLGVIWRVDPTSGRAEQVVRDAQLVARPFISLAPGANGLHFRGRDMFVTVSDRATVLRYTMGSSGSLRAAAIVATGIPGDDFAIDSDGTMYVSTHPYNTIVKVSVNGTRTIVGKEAEHIVGATDAAFGKTAQDRKTLYVVTDGGAFSGGAKTRGQLVAMQVE